MNSQQFQHHMRPSRAKHNSNHRKLRRKAAKICKHSIVDGVGSAGPSSASSTAASSDIKDKRSSDRAVAVYGQIEGIVKKKPARGRPNRPWKPWSKLSISDIEEISDRRGNNGRGFEQSAVLPSKRTQKRKGIDLLSFCPQPPKLTTRAIMEAHAPALESVSADADTLRLERENSSLLDEQVILEHDCISPQPNTERKVARETMLALLDPSDAEAFSTSAAAAKAATSPDKCHSWPAQAQSVYDEFGNDEIQLLRQTVSDLQQQVSMLQSELQKYRRRKAGK